LGNTKAVKWIVRACVICKKFKGPLISPNLPAYRVSFNLHVVLDYAGTLYVKAGRASGKDTGAVLRGFYQFPETSQLLK